MLVEHHFSPEIGRQISSVTEEIIIYHIQPNCSDNLVGAVSVNSAKQRQSVGATCKG